jgi:hypothetical protein
VKMLLKKALEMIHETLSAKCRSCLSKIRSAAKQMQGGCGEVGWLCGDGAG